MLKRKLVQSTTVKLISQYSTKALNTTTKTIPSIITTATATNTDVSKPTFHKRPLPLPLIALSSPEGKILFREAMTQGGMESFFALSEQFITQSDPAFCSLSSLAMVLNALNFDPKRVWKGSWRWVSEEMLQCESKELCCHSIDKIRQHGMDFNGFESLARCHGVNIDSIRVTPEYANTPHNYDQFKQQIIDVSCNDKAESFMVVNFSRQTLGQTGDGHFSPIGGYHKEKELVLILDVARFKYPPYWVSIQSLWQSMQGKDQFSGKSRGYFNISIATAKESATGTAESIVATRAVSIAAAIARGEACESAPSSLLRTTDAVASMATLSSSPPSESSCIAVPLLAASSSSCVKVTVSDSSSSPSSSSPISPTLSSSSSSSSPSTMTSSSCCSSPITFISPSSTISNSNTHKISSSSNSNNSSSSSSRNIYTASRLITSSHVSSSSSSSSMNSSAHNMNRNSISLRLTESSYDANTPTAITSPTATTPTAIWNHNGRMKMCTNSNNCSQRLSENNTSNHNGNMAISMCSC